MNAQPQHSLGYEPVRAYIRERLKSLSNEEVRAELQQVVVLCDGLEHQAQLLDIALRPAKEAA